MSLVELSPAGVPELSAAANLQSVNAILRSVNVQESTNCENGTCSTAAGLGDIDQKAALTVLFHLLACPFLSMMGDGVIMALENKE